MYMHTSLCGLWSLASWQHDIPIITAGRSDICVSLHIFRGSSKPPCPALPTGASKACITGYGGPAKSIKVYLLQVMLGQLSLTPA